MLIGSPPVEERLGQCALILDVFNQLLCDPYKRKEKGKDGWKLYLLKFV